MLPRKPRAGVNTNAPVLLSSALSVPSADGTPDTSRVTNSVALVGDGPSLSRMLSAAVTVRGVLYTAS